VIISASRRTDIPAFYSEWFVNRLEEGHVLIQNPYDRSRLRRVALSPDNVDCIVFWTKNPLPMFDRLRRLDSMGYRYYFHFTLTPYGRDVEPNLPPKSELTEAFRELSGMIGPTRSVWRYDPVIIDCEHPVEWHLERFAEMCRSLRGYTERCFLSFVDPYRNLGKRFRKVTPNEMVRIASGFSEIARMYGISVLTCAEDADLSGYGVGHGACIDRELIERVIGHDIIAKKDMSQRDACRCAESVDVGAYDTCSHGCTYCYGTSYRSNVLRRMAAHDPRSPIITGYPRGDETVTDRTGPSQRIVRLTSFLNDGTH
jgi:hypothetical protein